MAHNLVELLNIKKDMAAYTGSNYFKKKFYETNKCLVHKDLVDSINKINNELKKDNLQLCIIDAYRPLSVQKEIFKLIGGDTRYVSDPNNGRHPRGTAIDVTLYTLDDVALEMPTGFSDFGEKCGAFAECSEMANKNRTKLQTIMTDNGFEIYEYEWWHFDFCGWNSNKYPLIDVKI